MQIGGRWRVGTPPPGHLSASFVAKIDEAEARASDAERAGSWTLTWLEGRPVAESDGGLRVTEHGDVPVSDAYDDDDLFPLD